MMLSTVPSPRAPRGPRSLELLRPYLQPLLSRPAASASRSVPVTLSASSLGKLEQHHQTWGFPGFPQKNQGRNYGLTPKMTILAKKDADWDVFLPRKHADFTNKKWYFTNFSQKWRVFTVSFLLENIGKVKLVKVGDQMGHRE